VGLGGVLLLWARPHAAVIVAVVGLFTAWREQRIGIALRAGLPGLISLPLLCAWTHWVYGSWSPFPLYGSGAFSQVEQSMFDLKNQAAMWVSPDRGLFVFTPVLLVLLPTLVRVWRELPSWSTTLLVAGLTYTGLQAALISYSGGYPIYGYRYGLEFLACATPALAFAACRAAGWARWALAPVLALQFTVIALGAVFSSIWLLDTDGWTNNAFVHAMYQGAPGAPLLAVLVTCVTWWALHLWSRGRLSAKPPAELTQARAVEDGVLLAERR
jgi:alpha-1,2-mannosyltransferase